MLRGFKFDKAVTFSDGGFPASDITRRGYWNPHKKIYRIIEEGNDYQDRVDESGTVYYEPVPYRRILEYNRYVEDLEFPGDGEIRDEKEVLI